MWTQCWLDYGKFKETGKDYEKYFGTLYVEGFKKDEVILTARDELVRASLAMFGKTLETDIEYPAKGIVIKKCSDDAFGPEGYRIF